MSAGHVAEWAYREGRAMARLDLEINVVIPYSRAPLGTDEDFGGTELLFMAYEALKERFPGLSEDEQLEGMRVYVNGYKDEIEEERK